MGAALLFLNKLSTLSNIKINIKFEKTKHACSHSCLYTLQTITTQFLFNELKEVNAFWLVTSRKLKSPPTRSARPHICFRWATENFKWVLKGREKQQLFLLSKKVKGRLFKQCFKLERVVFFRSAVLETRRMIPHDWVKAEPGKFIQTEYCNPEINVRLEAGPCSCALPSLLYAGKCLKAV